MLHNFIKNKKPYFWYLISFMKKNIVYIFLFFSTVIVAQNKSDSQILKDSLYQKYRPEVINYSLKQFDELFMEFHQKTGANNNEILSEEQFYTYTVKIAIFSERFAKLYPKEKEEAMKNQQEWLSKTYEDYLKKKQKN
jgi:hypothetical protein